MTAILVEINHRLVQNFKISQINEERGTSNWKDTATIVYRHSTTSKLSPSFGQSTIEYKIIVIAIGKGREFK